MDKKLMDELRSLNNQIYGKVKDSIVHESNPKVVEKLRNTPYENDLGKLKQDLQKIILNVNNSLNDNFRRAWINLFEKADVNPFSRSYMDIKDDFVNDSLSIGEDAFKPDYATNWLKFNLITDRDGERKL
tara:strand:+ start:79 stop:468 length:390 start_codon:yes stop_codon:yes gene_type:complete